MTRRLKTKRLCAAVAEFAVVAPIFMLLVFGMMEFGRAIMVQQVLVNASREGARQAVLDGATTTDVQDQVNLYLDPSGIDGESIAYFVNGSQVSNPTGNNSAFGDAIGVEVSVNFSNVSWMPVPKYIGGAVLRARSTMRRETSQ